MTKMYIEKYTVMGAGWYIYRIYRYCNQSVRQKKKKYQSVLDGEVRIRTIGISKIIVALT
jgi:hypothetical protein